MKKTALGLCALATALSIAFVLHAGFTGIGAPYPDPTPAQAAQERLQVSISSALFNAGTAAWIAALVAGAVALIRRRR
jgi:hypothetical protein